jgi:hypothetical protein
LLPLNARIEADRDDAGTTKSGAKERLLLRYRLIKVVLHPVVKPIHALVEDAACALLVEPAQRTRALVDDVDECPDRTCQRPYRLAEQVHLNRQRAQHIGVLDKELADTAQRAGKAREGVEHRTVRCHQWTADGLQ